MKKKQMKDHILLGYYEDDGELSFIVFVTDVNYNLKEFSGHVIAANNLDDTNPSVGEFDNAWTFKDPHWKQIPNQQEF